MKNRIIKAALSVAALLMVITVSYAFVSKKTQAPEPKAKAVTVWYFVGNAAQEQDASYWTTTNPNNPDCGSGTDLPCDISVDASTSSQLQTFLSAHSDAQINALANDLRPE